MLGLEGRTGRGGYAAATVVLWLEGPIGAAISRALLRGVEVAPDVATARLTLDIGNLFGLVWTLVFTGLFFLFTIRRARDIGWRPLTTFIVWKVLTIIEASRAAAWSPEISTLFGDWRVSSLVFQIIFTVIMIAMPSKDRPEPAEPLEFEPAFTPPPQRPMTPPLTPSSTRSAFGLRQ